MNYKMMFTGGALGFLMGYLGFHLDSWQFWTVIILNGISGL